MIDDRMAIACSCGSVRFNLLRSGAIECEGCGTRFGRWSEHSELSHKEIRELWAKAESSDEDGGPVTRFARLLWRYR